MLKSLRQRFGFLSRAEADQPDAQTQLRDAVATLLFIILLSDDRASEEEIALIRKILSQRYQVSDNELQSTIDELGQRASDSVSNHKELQLIRKRCDQAQRAEILALCWQMAYADGELSPDEEHLIRRIAQMLHLSHSDYIRSKIKWQDSMASAG